MEDSADLLYNAGWMSDENTGGGQDNPTDGSDPLDAGIRERRVDINREFASLDAFLSEYMSNISHTGAFIRTRDPWPVGSRLRVKFTVLADDPEIFEGVAAVVRVSEEPRGMGVEFVDLTPDSRRLIDKLLKRSARVRALSSS